MKQKTVRYLCFCGVITFVAAIAASPAVAGSNQWTSNGPEGSAITTLIADRSNAATLYAGTDAG